MSEICHVCRAHSVDQYDDIENTQRNERLVMMCVEETERESEGASHSSSSPRSEWVRLTRPLPHHVCSARVVCLEGGRYRALCVAPLGLETRNDRLLCALS